MDSTALEIVYKLPSGSTCYPQSTPSSQSVDCKGQVQSEHTYTGMPNPFMFIAKKRNRLFIMNLFVACAAHLWHCSKPVQPAIKQCVFCSIHVVVQL